MCGIFGFLSTTDNYRTIDLIAGLKSLEYRGYDSAGIAFVSHKNTQKQINVIKAIGKVKELETKAKKELPKTITIGIAHTRWATHGRVTEQNTHPHTNKELSLALVHNGIVENYAYLKKQLLSQGYSFYSDTDTEVIVKLLDYNLKKQHDTFIAWQNTLKQIKGTYAFAVINLKNNTLLFAKNQSPLVLGITKDTIFVASDPTSLIKYTNEFVFLEDGTYGSITKYNSKPLLKIFINNKPQKIISKKINMTTGNITKKHYKYFMEKEIYEQPNAITNTIKQFNHNKKNQQKIHEAKDLINSALITNKLIFLACGTSYHASLIGAYWLSELTGFFPHVFLASEFKYLNYKIDNKTVAIAISQSGETADLIQAIKKVKHHHGKIISIINVPFSSIDRLSNITLYTKAGPEIGVASTKAFTTQLAILAILSGLNKTELDKIPTYIDSVLSNANKYKVLAKKIKNYKHMFYLGRNINYPVAKEGALKMKEISYIQAEAYTSGEMKHGPIALIDDKVLTIAVAPKDKVFDKTFSNIQEILARNGNVILITNKSAKKEFGHITNKDKVTTLFVPNLNEPLLYPFLTTIQLQLLALYTADLKRLSVDKPRNLAKSVTVE